MPFGGVVDPEGECVAHEAHISLHQLVEIVTKRQRAEQASTSPKITGLLYNVSQVEPYCARFCWTASRILLGIPPELWPVHPRFWDVFGLIAGHAARVGDNNRSGVILKRCQEEFQRTNNWFLRSYIANAMTKIGRDCVLRDARAESVLSTFRIKCENGVRTLEKVTKPMGDTIRWLFNAWAEIAVECRRGRARVLQPDAMLAHAQRQALATRIAELSSAIVREAFPLFRLYDIAEDLGCADTADCWPYWCQMIECALPTQEWSPAEVRLVGTPGTKSETKHLVDSMQPLVAQWTDPVKKENAQRQIAGLESSLRIISALQDTSA
jgi:hypothetical protein